MFNLKSSFQQTCSDIEQDSLEDEPDAVDHSKMNGSSHEKRHAIWEQAKNFPYIDSQPSTSDNHKTSIKSNVFSTIVDTKIGSWRESSTSPSPIKKKTTFESDVKGFRGRSSDQIKASDDFSKSESSEKRFLEKGKTLNGFELSKLSSRSNVKNYKPNDHKKKNSNFKSKYISEISTSSSILKDGRNNTFGLEKYKKNLTFDDDWGLNSNSNLTETQFEKKVRIEDEPIRWTRESQSSEKKFDKKSLKGKEVFSKLIEIPVGGWSLKDAIGKKLINPKSGMFKIPNTEREINFKECVKLNIINPLSAFVVNPSKSDQRTLPLKKSLEKGLIDEKGNYFVDKSGRKKINMEEALDKNYIYYDSRFSKSSDDTTTRILRIIKTDGTKENTEIYNDPFYYEDISEARESDQLKKIDTETTFEEFVELLDHIYYSPTSDTVVDEVANQTMSLKEALSCKKIDLNLFAVIDTAKNEQIILKEAADRDLFNSITYQVKDKKNNRIFELDEAVKRGLFVLDNSPSLLMKSAAFSTSNSYHQDESRLTKKDKKLGREGQKSSKVIRETVQVLKSREIFIKDSKTGKELSLDEALTKGAIDHETAERIKNKETSSSNFSVQRSIGLTIQDPRTGKALPLEVALENGIIDQSTADRIKRGDIVENIVKTNVTVVDDETENWSDIVFEINQRLDLIQEFKKFQECYESLKKWLSEMDKRVKSLKLISSSVKNIENNLEEIQKMREEFKIHKKSLKLVQESGQNCQSRMESSSLEKNRIKNLLESIQQQWDLCYIQLNDQFELLNDTLKTAKVYEIKILKIEDNLNQIDHEYDSIERSKSEVEMKLKELDLLEVKLSEQKSLIGECEAICDHFCEILADSNSIHEIQNKINAIERHYKELNYKLKEMRTILKEINDFYEKSKNFSEWQEEIREIILREPILSISERKLREELRKYAPILEEVERKEHTYRDLLEMGKEMTNLVKEVSESSKVNSILESITRRWDQMKLDIEIKISKLEQCLQECRKYTAIFEKLKPFIAEREVDISNWQEISSNSDVLEKQLQEVQAMKNLVNSQSKELQQLSEVSLTCFNRDVNEAREEINELKKRWFRVSDNIDKRIQSINNAYQKLFVFKESIKNFESVLIRFEEKIETYHIFDSNTLDLKLVEKVRSLIEECKTIDQKLFETREKCDELIKEYKIQSEVNKFKEIVKVLEDRHQNIKVKLDKHYLLIQSTLSTFDTFHHKLETINRMLIKQESNFSKLSSVSIEVRILEKQVKETNELDKNLLLVSQNIEEVKSMIKQEESNKSFQITMRNFLYLLESIESRTHSLSNKVEERKSRIEIALQEWVQLEQKLKELEEWCSRVERYIEEMDQEGYLMETIEKQMTDNELIQQELNDKKQILQDFEKKEQSKDHKEMLLSIQNRWDKLISKCVIRTKNLNKNYINAKDYFNQWAALKDWLNQTADKFKRLEETTSIRVAKLIEEVKNVQKEMNRKTVDYENIYSQGKNFRDKSLKSDAVTFQRMIDELKKKWTLNYEKCLQKLKQLEKLSSLMSRYNEMIKDIKNWLNKVEVKMDYLMGDLDTVKKIIKDHSLFQNEIKSRLENFNYIKQIGEEYIALSSLEESKLIRKEINNIKDQLQQVITLSEAKEKKLKESLAIAEEFQIEAKKILNWLNETEAKIKALDMNTEDEFIIRRLNLEIEKLNSEIFREKNKKEKISSLGELILHDCHPDGEYTVRHWIRLIKSKWDEVLSSLKERDIQSKQILENQVLKQDQLKQLLEWMRKIERELLIKDNKIFPSEPKQLQALILNLEHLKNELKKKEPEVDQVAYEYTKKTETFSGRVRIFTDNALNISLDSFSNSQAKELIQKWQKSWHLLEERLKMLQERLNFIKNLEKVKVFNFEEWRIRFLDWMDQRKAKLMNFFRNIDKDRDNKVTVQQFIEGFMDSNFPTSRNEMNEVAQIFDHNNDGFIDHREYLITLQVKTDEEVIKDEVQRQVAECTCINKYKVSHVDHGHFRFGDSQKLRLVRVLRSVVMVRVGGGWVSLFEFLFKNDPCRAKGRTNVELREPLAEGASQSMASFKDKPFHSKLNLNLRPIIKVRERTEKSLPMIRSLNFEDQLTNYQSLIDSRPRIPSRIFYQSSVPTTLSRSSSEMSLESLEECKSVSKIRSQISKEF